MVRDTSSIANWVSWKVALVMGVALFAVFYWALPAWLQSQIDSGKTINLKPMLEIVIGRRVHWSRLLGITLALVCLVFAAWNYFGQDRLNSNGERNVGFISRLLARLLQ
jgi:hypothetical protein